jgi:hypothetical protein
MSKSKTKNVTTTIIEDDYEFLRVHNLQVSAALSIGIQSLKKIFEEPPETQLSPDDVSLIKEILQKNKNVLKRLGEADETK